MAFESFFVGVFNEDNIIWIDTVEYRVKRKPSPKILIAGVWYGLIKKNYLLNAPVVLAELEDINIFGYAQVHKYSYEIWRNETLIFSEKNIEGNKFTDRLIAEIHKSQKGDKYYFFDVFVFSSQDSCLRVLDSTMYEIE